MYNSTSTTELQHPFRENCKRLYQLGLSILPLHFGKKEPACKWKPLQTVRLTPEEVHSWCNRQLSGTDIDIPFNIGIITGKLSGIIIVDADNAEAVKYINEHLPYTPIQVTTRKGMHFYYRFPEGATELNNKQGVTFNGGVTGIDIRGEGGYPVGPGSVHESGFVYQYAGDWSKWSEMPVYDPAWLVPDNQQPAHQSRQPSTGQRAPGAPEAAPVLACTDTSADARVAAWEEYLSHCGGSVAGSGASNYCYSLACLAYHGFGLEPEEALPAFLEWGSKPNNVDADGGWYPWTEAELMHKLEDGRTSPADPEKPHGYLLPVEVRCADRLEAVFAAASTSSVINPETPAEQQAAPVPETPATATLATPKRRTKRLGLLTADEFDALADEESDSWLIDNILGEQSLTIFSGKPYSGKTYAVRYMIGSLLEGAPFFNYPTAQSAVLYINADRNKLKRTRAEILKNLPSASVADYKKFFFAAHMDIMPERFEPKLLEYLAVQTIEELKERGCWNGRLIVIIDTFRSAFLCGAEQGAESDSTSMITLLKPIKALVKQLQINFFIIHHDPKHSSGSAGSGAIPGTTDEVWGYERDRESRVAKFKIATRDEDFKPLTVVKNENGLLELGDDDVINQIVKSNELDAEIVSTCSAIPFGAENAVDKHTAKTLLYGDAIVSEDTVVRRLKRAERPGVLPRLERMGKGTKTDAYQWYRVG